MSAAQWFSCRFSKPLITLQTSAAAAAASLFHAFHALAGLKNKKGFSTASPRFDGNSFSSVHRVQAKLTENVGFFFYCSRRSEDVSRPSRLHIVSFTNEGESEL